jgi:hypothetical protein
LPPVAMIRSAPSGSGRCSALASSHGARIQTSCSSGVVRIVKKRPRLTPPPLGRSMAWPADRRRDPASINSVGVRQDSTFRSCRDCGRSILSFIPRKMVHFARQRANEPSRSVKTGCLAEENTLYCLARPMPAWKSSQFSEANYFVDKDIVRKLEQRLGPIHARQRLGIEKDHEAQVFGQGLTFFHLENLHLAPAIIRNALKLTGLYWRARRNADRIIVKRNDLRVCGVTVTFRRLHHSSH